MSSEVYRCNIHKLHIFVKEFKEIFCIYFFVFDSSYSSMVSALSSRLTIDVDDEGGLLGDASFPRAHCDRSSIGKGNIMVEFFSALIEFRVCKYRS